MRTGRYVAAGLVVLAGIMAILAINSASEPSSTETLAVPGPPEGVSSTTSAPEVATTGLRDIPKTTIEPPGQAYDPVAAGEPVPEGYRDTLGRDSIEPIYNPGFRSAPDTEWPADSLVIGVEIEGDARAYPVSFLTRREMVVDRIAGIPVLVTW